MPISRAALNGGGTSPRHTTLFVCLISVLFAGVVPAESPDRHPGHRRNRSAGPHHPMVRRAKCVLSVYVCLAMNTLFMTSG